MSGTGFIGDKDRMQSFAVIETKNPELYMFSKFGGQNLEECARQGNNSGMFNLAFHSLF